MYRTDPGKVIIASVELFSCPSELNPMHVGITFMYIEHNKACLCFRRVNRKCTVEEDETCLLFWLIIVIRSCNTCSC